MFTVKGKIREKTYSVTYDNGKLTGDKVAIDIVTIEAKALEGHPVGPVGQYTNANHLQDPVSAIFLIMGVFTTIEAITGDIPEADEPPEGAIV